MSSNSGRSVMSVFIGFVIVFVFAFAGGVYFSKYLGGEDENGGAGKRSSAQGTSVKKQPRDQERRASDRTPTEEQKPEAGDETHIVGIPEEKPEPKIEIGSGEEEVKSEVLLSPEVEEVTEPVSLPTRSPEPKVTKSQQPKVALLKKPEEVKVASLPPRLRDRGKYTVQVGSFVNEKEAKRVERLLKSKGYPAFTKKAIVADKGTWFRVRVGTFVSRSEAKRYGEVLKSSEDSVKDIFITINN